LCSGGDLEGLLCKQVADFAFSQRNSNEDGLNQNVVQKQRKKQQQKWFYHSIPFYISQIFQAVQFLHTEKQILHCDLKPSNCLLDADTGQLKLADFTSAIEMKSSATLQASLVSSQRRQKQQKKQQQQQQQQHIPRGSSDYSCPEILRATSPSSLSEAVDYWSVGCILYAMTHLGKSPFCRESEALTVEAIMEYCKEGQLSTLNEPNNVIEITTNWTELATGLIRPAPHDRICFWRDKIVTNSLLQGTVCMDTEHVILPYPQWKHEVEEADLKDGNMGWIAFQQM
jgi:serine/threonine protein kinase